METKICCFWSLKMFACVIMERARRYSIMNNFTHRQFYLYERRDTSI